MLTKTTIMGKQWQLGWKVIVFSILCNFVYNSSAETCENYNDDCNACKDFETFPCHFVENKYNNTLTLCLTDDQFHGSLNDWIQEQEHCNVSSNSSESAIADAPNTINATLSPVTLESNNTKESNDSSVINSKDQTTESEKEKTTEKSETIKNVNDTKTEESNEEVDNSQSNTNVSESTNPTKNSTHDTSNATSKPISTKPPLTPVKNDTKDANTTVVEHTPQEDKSSFHGGSFIGGIILVICISLAIFFGLRYYKAYKEGRPFSHRLFGNNDGFAASRQDSDEPGFPF